MGKSKALVRVKVVRVFEYPKSMLHRLLFLDDAKKKAYDDMQTVIDEIVNNDHAPLSANMFDYEAEEHIGYKYRVRQLPEEGGDKIHLYKAAKALTTAKLELKYGQLNH